VIGVIRDWPRRRVGPLEFTVARYADFVSAIAESRVRPAKGVAIHFANAYTVALADSDARYADALMTAASVCVTDGMPISWAGRRFYPEVKSDWDRVSGADVMGEVLARSDFDGPRHYFLGGDEPTLQSLIDGVRRDYPDARIAGYESPPFRELTTEEKSAQDRRIADSEATHVWVGLGTPKQDWEVVRLAAELPVVALAVGAAFDFIAGTKSRAPEWMRSSGLEWAHRLASEPVRLTQRYLWGNPRFVWAAWRGRP